MKNNLLDIKFFLLLFVLLQGAFISLFVGVFPNGEPQEKSDEAVNSVTVIPPVIDFGTVSETTVSGTVELVNNLSETIVLKCAVPSCTSCTEIDLPEQDILPGSRVSLVFRTDMSGKMGDVRNSIVVMYTKKGDDYVSTFTVLTIAKVLSAPTE
ncbi:MAG: DUF1573 domain-containing protein [Planctomycetaceae bacterium]|jgi:hypothetical protein|nr:DUF1573 domain-containing protein [Planctomycetaceae bacterium]